MKNLKTILFFALCFFCAASSLRSESNGETIIAELAELSKAYDNIQAKLTECRKTFDALEPATAPVKKYFEIKDRIEELKKRLKELDEKRKKMKDLLAGNSKHSEDISSATAVASNQKGGAHQSHVKASSELFLYAHYDIFRSEIDNPPYTDKIEISVKSDTGEVLAHQEFMRARKPGKQQRTGILLPGNSLKAGINASISVIVTNCHGQSKSDTKYFKIVKDLSSKQEFKEPGNNLETEKTEKDTPTGKKAENKEDSSVNGDKAPKAAKIKLLITPATIKPGGLAHFKIEAPIWFVNPKIEGISCSSNLTPYWSRNSMSGSMEGDSLIEREEKGDVVVTVSDDKGNYGSARGVVIISSSEEYKLAIKIKTRLESGKSYDFSIAVPADFKPPYSVYIKYPSAYLDVNYQSSSLGGTVVAVAKVMSSCTITAQVYDAAGRRGYASKTVTVKVPEKTEDEKLPEEKPPTWLEETADVVWEGMKDGMNNFGEGMKNFNEAMNNMTPEQRVQWQQSLSNLQKAQSEYYKAKYGNSGSYKPKYPVAKPPPTPHWMKPAAPQRTQKEVYGNVRVTINSSHPNYIKPGWGGVSYGSFTASTMRGEKFSTTLPFRGKIINNSASPRITASTFYIEDNSQNMSLINKIKVNMKKSYQKHLSECKKHKRTPFSFSEYGPYLLIYNR